MRLIGIERFAGQAVDRLHAAPVKRHEDRVLARRRRHLQRERPRRTAGGEGDALSIGQAELPRGDRMHFGERLRGPFFQLADMAGLRARLVVREHAPGREEQRILVVSSINRCAMGDGVKSRAAGRCGKGFGEQARRSRMIECRTRPEDAVFGGDSLVGDPRIVRRSAFGRATELGEHLAAVRDRKKATLAKGGGEGGERFEIRTHARGRVDRTAAENHATFEVRHRPVLLGPLGGRQDDVGEHRGLREEELRDDQELERLEPVGDPCAVGHRHGDVRADHDERVNAIGRADRVNQLVCRSARTGNGCGRDAPDLGDGCPCGRIVDAAVSGELIGLLAVLAAPLAVALTGNRAVAAVRLSDAAESERQVDVGQGVVHALRLLLGASRRQNHRPFCRPEQPRGLDDRVFGHAGELLDAVRPVRRRDPAAPRRILLS